MSDAVGDRSKLVRDYMVKSPVTVESWQPVARARQLMLMYSFSYLPVEIDQTWKLVSEGALAKYLAASEGRNIRLATSITDACQSQTGSRLELLQPALVSEDEDVGRLLGALNPMTDRSLWLVKDANGRLCGVLTPFELM